MEGVLALMIPIVAVCGFFAWALSTSPVGKALADRLRGNVHRAKDADDKEEVLEALEGLRREVAELAERVDFTERMLGQRQGGERLAPPRA